MAEARQWSVGPGEEARLTPEGPTAALIESRGPLPLRSRSKLHPGSAVALGPGTFEVVSEERGGAACVYRLERWPREHVVRDRVVYGPRLVRAVEEQRRRESRERWVGPALAPVRLVLEAFAALLPAPERRGASERLSLDAVRGTFLLCGLQLFGGAVLWAFGFVAAGQAQLEAVAGQHTRAATAPSDAEVRRAYAPFLGGSETWSPEGLRFLAYAFTPQGLILEYAFLTGFVRTLNLVATRQPLGDPLLSLLLGVLRGGRARRREQEREGRLGPERPDRVLHDGEDLIVLAAREKPDWNERSTIEVGEQFYRLRDVSERPDENRRVLAYRLRPLEAGAVMRGLVRYAAPAAGDRPRPTAALPLALPAPPRAAPARVPVKAGTRQHFTIDEGEEARLTPEGPTAAVIESLGSLPLRPRSEALGVHHRPEFPGSCVALGDARYEVVEEQPLELGFRYLLEPWQDENVQRDAVAYGPRLVRAAQHERRRALERERASRYSAVLYPFVGLLPEERQLLACDRLGLDAQIATLAGAGLEIGGALMLALSSPGKGPAPLAAALPLAGLVVAPAIFRVLGAVLFRQAAGNPFLTALLAATDTLRESARRSDASVLPLTREAFWTRLMRPDKREPQRDGSLIVTSLLPHLSWESGAMLRVGGDHWRVMPLPAVVQQGRLVHSYQLWPLREAEMLQDLPDTDPPDPRHYQSDVLEQVSRDWDDVFGVAPWLPPLLPRAAQERAYRGRGGAAASLRWAVLTASATLAVAVWFLLGRGAVNVLTGLVCASEGSYRLWRAIGGGYAPSLIGHAISDYMRPERVAYQAHLEAERRTLQRLRDAP
jgi:hypothetical protein